MNGSFECRLLLLPFHFRELISKSLLNKSNDFANNVLIAPLISIEQHHYGRLMHAEQEASASAPASLLIIIPAERWGRLQNRICISNLTGLLTPTPGNHDNVFQRAAQLLLLSLEGTTAWRKNELIIPQFGCHFTWKFNVKSKWFEQNLINRIFA